ncbi:MAG: hypothetical protein AB4368_28065 [Xenococcaceae cyanobacterium]
MFSSSILFKSLIAPIAALACAGGILNLQQSQLKTSKQTKTEDYAKLEQYQKTRLDFLKKSSAFGFSNLVANWAFLDFVQYFGDAEAREETGYALTPDYFTTIISHDPRFTDAYLYLAPANSLFAGKPEKTVAFMTEGLKYLSPEIPKSYMVWTFKAVDELLFLGDNKAAQNSYEMGAKWAEIQNDETSQAIGARAKETAEFLATNPDSRKAQASSWMMIYSNARDEYTRKMALNKIENIVEEVGGEVIITPYKITIKMPEENQS